MSLSIIPSVENNIDSYMKTVEKYPLLSREDEYTIAVRYYEHKDVEAAHSLVVSNLKFVVKIAKEYKKKGTNLIDLIQEGNLGLMRAVKSFDPFKGYRLITYAVWWIRAQIKEYLKKTSNMVNCPISQKQKQVLAQFKAKRWKESQENRGQVSSVRDVAVALQIPDESISELELRLACHDFSLEAPVSNENENGFTYKEALSDDLEPYEDIIDMKHEHRDLHHRLDKIFTASNEKEKFIIDNRLLSETPLTLQEIGAHFNVSRERIRQLEKRVYDRLKKSYSDRPIARA